MYDDDIDDIEPTDAYTVLRDALAEVGGPVLPEDPADLPRGSRAWGLACVAAESLPHGSALVRAAWDALGDLAERTWAEEVEIGYDLDLGGYSLDRGPTTGTPGHRWLVDDSDTFDAYFEGTLGRTLARGGGVVLLGYVDPAYGGGARPEDLPPIYRGAVRVGVPMWMSETDHDCDCRDAARDEGALSPEGGHVACHRCGGSGSVVSPALVAVAYVSASDAPIDAVRAAVHAAGYQVTGPSEGGIDSYGWTLLDSYGGSLGIFTSEINALLWAVDLESPH